jgi:hypothetical protein
LIASDLASRHPPKHTVNSRRQPPNNVTRWLPAGAAGGLLVAVIAAGVISGDSDDPSPAADGTVAHGDSAATGTTTLPLALSELPVSEGPVSTENYDDQVVVEDVAVAKVPLGRTLADGLAGADVERVQQRLTDLAFDPGPVDGIYGTQTRQAVWAFEKLVLGVPRADATGRVTPAMWDQMQDPITIKPRRPTGGLADHTEVYLPEQVMIVFHGDVPALVAHIASGELDENGDPAKYCETISIDTDASGNPLPERVEKAICGFSKTPPGVFEAERKIEGTRDGPLGSMWDPIYINYGIAIHGADNVPLQPASHGCIRVNRNIGSYLQTILELGDRVLIWDGKKEPEQQSDRDMLPVFDFPDPDATTTTSTTTSTTTTTTLAPETTLAPTKPPPTTTTTTTTTVAPTTTTSTTTTTEPPDD